MVDRTRGSDWLPQQSDFPGGGACMRFAAPFTNINSLFSMLWNLRCPPGSALIDRQQKICNVIGLIHTQSVYLRIISKSVNLVLKFQPQLQLLVSSRSSHHGVTSEMLNFIKLPSSSCSSLHKA